jgi:hypothetical protein
LGPAGFSTGPGAMPRLPGALGSFLALVPRQTSAPPGRGHLSPEPRARDAQLALHPPAVEELGDGSALTEPLRVLSLAPAAVGRLAGDRGLFRTHTDRVPAFRRRNRSKLADALQGRGELGRWPNRRKAKKRKPPLRKGAGRLAQKHQRNGRKRKRPARRRSQALRPLLPPLRSTPPRTRRSPDRPRWLGRVRPERRLLSRPRGRVCRWRREGGSPRESRGAWRSYGAGGGGTPRGSTSLRPLSESGPWEKK